MFREWIKTLHSYFSNAKDVLRKDINGHTFPKSSQIFFKSIFILASCIIVCFIPKGLSYNFIDYIKDIFAIFVGFFVTVLCFVFDKFDTEHVYSQEEKDKLPAEERGNANQDVKIKQEHNYTVRFFYTIGLIILYSATVIFLLIPNIFWSEWFDINVLEYEFVNPVTQFSWDSILTFLHLTLCILYRLLVVLLTIKVFYYTVFCVSSLLKVLLSKKKLESWS